MSLSFGDWPNYSSLANYSPWPHLSSYWSWALAYHLCGGKKSRVLHWKFNYHYLVYFVGLRKKVFHFIMQPNPKAVFCTSVLPLHLNSEHKISRTDILLLCYVIIYSCQWNHNESGNFTSEGRFFFFCPPTTAVGKEQIQLTADELQTPPAHTQPGEHNRPTHPFSAGPCWFVTLTPNARRSILV